MSCPGLCSRRTRDPAVILISDEQLDPRGERDCHFYMLLESIQLRSFGAIVIQMRCKAIVVDETILNRNLYPLHFLIDIAS